MNIISADSSLAKYVDATYRTIGISLIDLDKNNVTLGQIIYQSRLSSPDTITGIEIQQTLPNTLTIYQQ